MSNIYFLCPTAAEPSGGIKQLYRQTDILNRNGFNAAVLHRTPGFRHTWFENRTRIVYAPDLTFTTDDFLVIPEVFGPQLATFARGVRQVVFNQNCYRTFAMYGIEEDESVASYLDPEVVAVIAASDDAMRYLAYAFPAVRLYQISLGVDASLFSYQPAKKRRLAFMPRRLPEDITQVINILRFRGAIDDVELAPIKNMNEDQVAAVMKESLVFLSFNYREGFGLPPAEAMACGCIVVGYAGGGGKDYLLPEFSYPIPDGDIVAFARTVEEVLAEQIQDSARLFEKGRRASEFIRSRYSIKREEETCVAAWREITSKSK